MASRLNSSGGTTPPLVFFDLEATGLIQLGVLPDIIQIAAMCPDDDIFDRYILPEKRMTPSALQVTGLRVDGDRLLRHGSPVPTVGMREALRDFLDWLRDVAEKAGGKKPLLLAYNGTKFDAPVLRNTFKKCGLTDEAKECIGGFADVFQMALAKIRKKECGNYRLQTLARLYMKGTSHDAHNAVGDVKMLKGVYDARLAHATNLMVYKLPY
ncbi:maternal protein exuperantia-like [Littorina saxatilis]|uniref:Exonuclease domain-containing protein n=1 Tax=Littorina saxatilis TaxID=31220 RepID=A0AAN9ASM3_9CAEN